MDRTFRRKRNRLEHFDYSSSGTYFITLCCQDRKPLFWADPKQKCESAEDILLSPAGQIADQVIRAISQHYTGASVIKYCIMPDHVHILLFIESDPNGVTTSAPEISVIVGQMKSLVSKQIGESVWQKSYFDRVIRSDREYTRVWRYIDQNPCLLDHDDDRSILDLFERDVALSPHARP